MRLKHIELAGFKSFVDPVRIELGDGITAIVGPNGSGKSNIVDAIRWVLGEHSARHLRGGVMDDLIFQGSETRPPVGICDVELTFAVEPGTLSSPYHDMAEIRIRRRLTREGGSDAFINGHMVRIKDVVDLFLDTGLSSRAYAIIEQGAITRMISAKPEDRRLILEEAAGVMKYRSRRHEAELKMKATRQNLERIMDLLEEVRSQCRSLKQQASRAGRFKTLQDEWQRTRALSMAITYRQRREACRGEEQSLKQIMDEEAKAARGHAQAERELAEARQRLLRYEEEAQGAQDALREAERRRSGLQQQAERLAGERRLLAERRQVLEHRASEADSRRAHLQKELNGVEARIAGQDDDILQQALEVVKSEEESAREEHEAQRRLRDEMLAEFERIRGRHQGAERRREQAADALGRLRDRKTLLKGRQEDLHAQLEQVNTALEQARASVLVHERRQHTGEADLHSARMQLDTLRQQRGEADAQFRHQSGEVHRLQGEIEELTGRLSSQDIPGTLRDALRQAGAIWVDEALQAPEGLEMAAAAALRGQVADAQLPANPGLAELAETIQQSEQMPVAFHAGVGGSPVGNNLAVAMGLDQSHPLHTIFASVLMVDSIVDAPAVLAAEPRATAAVSRDGWRLEASGWLIPPAGKASARRFQFQRELHQRRHALLEAEERLQSREKRFREIEASLEDRQQNWQQLHLALTEAQSETRAKHAEVQRLAVESDALASRLERLQAEITELAQEHGRLSSHLSGTDEPDIERLAGAQKALDERNAAEAGASRHLEQIKNRRAAAEQTLALHRQASENLRREKQRLVDEIRRLTQQNEQDMAALEALAEDIRRAERQSEMDQALQQASGLVEQLHQELNRIRQHGHELQQAAYEAEKKERQVRTGLQEISDRRQQGEVALAASTARLQDLEDEIVQRCGQPTDALMQELEERDEVLDEAAILNRASELEARLDRFGPVNLLAIEEYEQA